jgi:hypothetical protein
MTTDDGIEGEPMKPYVLYRIGLQDEIIERVADADSLEELSKLRRRKDWSYRVYQPQADAS